MVLKHVLGVTDYIVIGLSLFVSAGIGIVSKIYGSKQNTSTEYLLAGKNMAKIPVILSIIITLTSPATMLSTPAEIYRYGTQFLMTAIGTPIGVYLAAWIFLPVYFQCGVSTTNEFLEMRYGKMIRYIIGALFIIQMVFYMTACLCGAVLALSAVTNLSFEFSVIALGIVCAFYCSIGGLRAVMWTDVFQAALMIICLLAMYIAGISDAGGFLKMFRQAKEGHRFDFNLKPDLLRRFDFWGCLSRGFMYGFGYYGTNQIEVQRTLSMSNQERAKSTLKQSAWLGTVMHLLCQSFGIVLYSIYYHCDPLMNKENTGLNKYDQMIPAYIVSRFSSIPGMTGLCFAGIFSAALSTISAALNSASTVTVVDFIKPLVMKGDISDAKTVFLAKAFSVFYGGACIGLSFCFLGVESLIQMLNSMLTALEGPMTAVFLVGVLTRKADDKCVSFALLTGFIAMAFVSFGSLFSKYMETPLPLSISNCQETNISYHQNVSLSSCLYNGSCTFVDVSTPLQTIDTSYIYKISFMWYPLMGFTLTLILILVSIIATGWKKNVIESDSLCLSPVIRQRTKSLLYCDQEVMKESINK